MPNKGQLKTKVKNLYNCDQSIFSYIVESHGGVKVSSKKDKTESS